MLVTINPFLSSFEAIESRIAAKNHSLKLDFPSQPLIINVDETRVIQAQTNLLVNACKNTPVGGQIIYSISLYDDEVVIEVCDDGEGMSDELLKKIFEVFVQADETLERSGGMGLGLPLVKMIAESHGGSISASNKGQGQGSVFQLRLPYKESELKVLQPEKTGTQKQPSGNPAGLTAMLHKTNGLGRVSNHTPFIFATEYCLGDRSTVRVRAFGRPTPIQSGFLTSRH